MAKRRWWMTRVRTMEYGKYEECRKYGKYEECRKFGKYEKRLGTR